MLVLTDNSTMALEHQQSSSIVSKNVLAQLEGIIFLIKAFLKIIILFQIRQKPKVKHISITYETARI